MGKKKYKPLTKKEKAFNKQIKAEMIAEGLLPPPKPRLNRKKFAEEVKEEFNDIEAYGESFYLLQAISIMTPSSSKKISSEELGVLKVMKLAVALKKFYKQKKLEGNKDVTIKDLYEEVIRPIVNL